MTGCGARSSNSSELAPARPARWRATSMVMHCRPRHRPRIGMPFSRAYRAAPILPSMPADAEPAGDHDAVDARAARPPRRPAVSQSSLGTQRSSTRARWANPAARIASLTDR